VCDDLGGVDSQYGFNGRRLQNLVLSTGWKTVYGERGRKLWDIIKFDQP
jgi:hypothetical protein